MDMKLFTVRSIISSSSIPMNNPISAYIFIGFICMHLTSLLLGQFYAYYAYHVLLMIICFLIFYANIMLLMILIYNFPLRNKDDRIAFDYVCLQEGNINILHFYLGRNKRFLVDKDDRKPVHYYCVWESKSSGAWILHLFHSCCHIVGRSNEVSLSVFDDIMMDNTKYNKRSYNVGFQSIEKSQTSTFRSYVSILRDYSFSTTCTGTWKSPIPFTILTTSFSSQSFQKRFLRQVMPRSIPRSPKCLERYMNFSMVLLRNTEKVSKVGVKKMRKS